MSNIHAEMRTALTEHAVPWLRSRGFRGSFPHFRRPSSDKIEMLTFQFDRHGGGLVIEAAVCPPDGITTYWDEHIPPGKVRIVYVHPNERKRFQRQAGAGREDWFRYDRGDIGNCVRQILLELPKVEDWLGNQDAGRSERSP